MNEIQANRFLKAKRALFDKYYSFLNEKQREAVYSVNGPVLILAGAGSGKTTVLVNRIAHIIKYGNAYYTRDIPEFMTEDTLEDLESAIDLPKEQIEKYLELFEKNPCSAWQNLAITFTNKAANEIKERLAKILNADAEDIWAGTFHSICMRILRKDGELVGYRPGFSVCDADDAKKTISTCVKELGINEKTLSVKDIQNIISNAKDKLLTPCEFRSEYGKDYKYKLIADVYEKYQKTLESSNLLDFDDIIMKTVMLLRQNPEVLSGYQNKFRYVCIDEYQDTNEAQFELTRMLSDFHRNIMVVGDDDQSIYKFRGATIENILSFDSTYNEAKVIKLEQNYRSTSNILNAANALISKNYHKHKKELWCNSEQGSKIIVKQSPTQNDEARFIVDEIIRLKAQKGYAYRDFAVLYRMNALSRSLETIFANSGIPYRMLGAHRFYDREEIKDIIAYLHVVNNPSDGIHLRRIYAKPTRGIGATSFERASTISAELGISVLEVMKGASTYNAIPKTATGPMQELAYLINSFHNDLDKTPISQLAEGLIKRTGYEKMLIEEGEAGRDRRENLEQLISAIKEYENEESEPTLTGFLEQISLVADVDKYDEND
ncbi:MAG: UvrD-helicase domain-containing protein, partial [Clostridia bacterium]|nr:UvrD-helicase domain-containing protein [Clostridia bacterium]